MTICVVQFWQCNVCGTRGPEFEGTAEAVIPNDWWVGELVCATALARGGVRRAQVSVCPDCVQSTGLEL